MREIFPHEVLNPNLHKELTYVGLVRRYAATVMETAPDSKRINDLKENLERNNNNGFPMIIQCLYYPDEDYWSTPLICMSADDIPRNTVYKHLAMNVPLDTTHKVRLNMMLIQNT